MLAGLGTSTSPILLIIRLPVSKELKLAAKMILLALLITALPSLGSAIWEFPIDIYTANPQIKAASPTNQEALHLLFHELSNEGHLKAGDRVLVITHDNDGNIYDSRTLGDNNEIKFVTNTDLQRVHLQMSTSILFSQVTCQKTQCSLTEPSGQGGLLHTVHQKRSSWENSYPAQL